MMVLILLLIAILNFNESLSHRSHKHAVSARIFGGLEADDGDYPYVVRLRNYRDRSIAFCSGSIIHEKWILTAGHCLSDVPREVTVGSNWASGYGGQAHEIKETFIPDNYAVWADVDRKTGKVKNYYSDNDVGLIQLKTPIDLSQPRVAKISIDTSQSNYDGQLTTYMGWGKSQADAYSPADRLQTAQARVMSTAKCQKDNPTWVIRNSMHICTSPDSNSTICPGDSGGPLVDAGTKKQIGIANHGTCGANEPSVFQRVSAHHAWIKETIEKHGDRFS